MRVLGAMPHRAMARGRARPDGQRRDARLEMLVRRAHALDPSELPERWLTKRELADHLRVTPRFIELQQHSGLPVLRIGAVNRYRISEVERWIRSRYPPTRPWGHSDGL